MLRSSFQQFFPKSVFLLVYYINKIIGQAPYSYNWNSGKFETSWHQLIYPTFMTIVSIGTYFGIMVWLNVDTVYFVVLVFFYFRLLTVLVHFICPCKNYLKIVYCLNQIQATMQDINQIVNIDLNKYLEEMVTALIVTSAICIIELIGEIGMHANVMEAVLSDIGFQISLILIIIIIYFCQNSIFNSFYGCICIITFHFKRINECTTALMKEAKYFQNVSRRKNSYLKMLKFCELSDRLDKISIVHTQLIDSLNEFNRIVSIQLFSGITFNLLVLIIHVSDTILNLYLLNCFFFLDVPGTFRNSSIRFVLSANCNICSGIYSSIKYWHAWRSISNNYV